MPKRETIILCTVILVLWIGQAYNYSLMRRLTCEHSWVRGPYLIQASQPPLTNNTNRIFVWVEHCPKCGLVRLDDRYRRETGHFLPLAKGPLPPTGLRIVPVAEQ